MKHYFKRFFNPKYILTALAVAICLAAVGYFSLRTGEQQAEKQTPQYIADSLNFVNARARFNAYSDNFVRVNKLSGGMADQMRDSVNIYYRVADSLKTVFEQSKSRYVAR